MVPAILFDVDGLIANFVKGACEVHGSTLHHNMKSIQWNFFETMGLTEEEFWKPCGRRFWANLEPLADGTELLKYAETLVGANRIGLLTSPCNTDGCIDGKRDWVAKHLPDYKRRLFTGSAKELFAGPGKVLVDDNDGNADKFVFSDGKFTGGRAVLVPRPWNRKRSVTDANGNFHVSNVGCILKSELEEACRG